MRRPQDTPLLAVSVKRVRKGVYDIRLVHPSGRKFDVERFFASSMPAARQQCQRLFPSTVFKPARTTKPRRTCKCDLDTIIAALHRNSGE
jgi:hypothetical protein